MNTFQSQEVEAKFFSYPDQFYKPLVEIREMIFEISEKNRKIGQLTEVLRWGQPSYLTEKTKSGSLVRIDRFGKNDIAVYFHCKTTLVQNFRKQYADQLRFSKNRAILLNPNKTIPRKSLASCISAALTYHIDKSNGKSI